MLNPHWGRAATGKKKKKILHLLTWRCFGRVPLAPLWTVDCQASLSGGFSRQEYCSVLANIGYHTLLKVKSLSRVPLFAALPNSLDCSLPGSSAHGIFQARLLEWVAIAFSAGTFRCLHFKVLRSSAVRKPSIPVSLTFIWVFETFYQVILIPSLYSRILW